MISQVRYLWMGSPCSQPNLPRARAALTALGLAAYLALTPAPSSAAPARGAAESFLRAVEWTATADGLLVAVHLPTGVEEPLGSTGIARMNSLARDPDGELWVIGEDEGGAQQLFTLDEATGAATPVAPVASGFSFRATAFSSAGILYGIHSPGIAIASRRSMRVSPDRPSPRRPSS